MKRILSLLLALAVCVPSHASYIFQASAAGSLNNPLLTGTVDFFGGQTTITDGGDRTVIRGDVFEIKNAAGTRNLIYAITTSTHPQWTITGGDLWFEQTDGGGAIGDIAALADGMDVGYSDYQQDDIVGFSPIRHLAMSGAQIFIPWASRASYTTASMAAVMKHTPGGTPGGNNQGIATTNINYWTWSNSGSGRYIEHYLGGSGLYFTQQNIDFELNYDSGKGRLIIADQNAAANGKRGQTVTLVGGTKDVTNDSVTANTVVNCSRSASGGTPGHIEAVISAGVGYTVNSSSATDTSTFKCFLWENGRP